MFPPLDHPCMGYVCGVPDGTIPGYTAWDCTGLGYSGALAGCVDPRCTGWRPSIPYCGPRVWQELQNQDPQVPQPLPLDEMKLFVPTSGKGSGCCCGGSGASGGPMAGLGTLQESIVPTGSGTGYDSSCGCTGTLMFLGLPWWVWLLILILVVKHGR